MVLIRFLEHDTQSILLEQDMNDDFILYAILESPYVTTVPGLYRDEERMVYRTLTPFYILLA